MNEIDLKSVNYETIRKSFNSLISILKLQQAGIVKLIESNEDDYKKESLAHLSNIIDFLLKNFDYLYRKTEYSLENNADCFFLIPISRLCTELVARVIYYLSLDDKNVVIYHRLEELEGLAKLYTGTGIFTNDDESTFKNKSNQFLALPDNYITDFPTNVHRVKSWFKKLRVGDSNLYKFPGASKVYSGSYLDDLFFFYQDKRKLISDIKEKYSFMFSYGSMFIHGNNSTKNLFGKEHYWILNQCYELSNLTCSVLDIKLCSRKHKQAIVDITSSYNKNYSKFLKDWNN